MKHRTRDTRKRERVAWEQREKASCRAEGWREAMSQSTNVVKPSSEAVPLHEGVRLEQRNKPLSRASITVWMGGLFRRGMHTPQCQGRRAERADYVHVSQPPLSKHTTSLALPVRVGVVSSSHTTKSLIGGVQNTWASGMLASVQYVPFPPVGSSAVEVTR